MARKKILALHGVAQSGPVFINRRINTIVDTLAPVGYDIIHLTAPFDIAGTAYINARQHDWVPGDDERSWWETDDATGSHSGIETAFALLGETLRTNGPFVGVLGFSQGGCAAASLAAMLEPARRGHPLVKKYMPSWHPPLDFFIMFSGNPYRHPTEQVHWLFYPEGGRDNMIGTKALAFYGQKEWARDQSQRERQAFFISRCADVTVMAHPWKHTVPRTQEYADVVRDFVLDVARAKESQNLKPSL
jgi:hypothetical protein